jgi:DNA polymerase
MKLIVSDLAQIEPRVLAWLVNDKVALDAMAAGDSPYVAHAKASMEWTPSHTDWVLGDLKAESPGIYALAKVRVLGLGYGAGWLKFITMAKSMAGLDITKGDPETEQKLTRDGELCWNADGTPKMVSGYGKNSRRIVKDFRDSNPGIVNLWRQLDEGFKAACGGDFRMQLPSGRFMVYRDVRSEWRLVPETDESGELTGAMKRKLVYTADVGGVRSVFYGGLLCENLVQATARDVFGFHMLLLDKTPGIRILFTVHDEVVLECENYITAKQVRDIMSIAPPWLKGCPVTAEANEVPCYCK